MDFNITKRNWCGSSARFDASIYPHMALEDLQRDEEFRRIALQPVNQTGYTSLHDSFIGIIRFHVDSALENKKSQTIKRNSPSLWSMIEKSLGKNHTSGYYEWTERNHRSSLA